MEMARLARSGIAIRTACGRTTRNKVARNPRPRLRAASHCPWGKARIAAQNASVANAESTAAKERTVAAKGERLRPA
jgi:hypothetical protein